MRCLASLLLGLCAVAAAADPAFYTRKATWQETMLASREALLAAEQARVEKLTDPVAKDLPASFQPFAAEVGAGQKGARRIRVRVTGMDVVWLSHAASQGGDGTPSGLWGEPTLVAKDGKKTRLLDLKPLVARGAVESVGGAEPAGAKGKARRRARTLRVGRQELAFGLVVEAGGELCYRLDRQFEWFEAGLGALGGGKKAPDLTFRVSALPLAETLARERARATLWSLVERDFTAADAVREMAAERARGIWNADWPAGQLAKLAQRYAGALPSSHPLRAAAGKAKAPAEVLALAKAFHDAQRTAEDLAQARDVNLKALRLAIEDLTRTFGDKYPRGGEYLKRLEALEKSDLATLAQADADKARELAVQLVSLQRDALLDNPLLDFDKLLLIQRSAKSPKMGMPQNWQGNCALPRSGFGDEIAILSPARPGGKLTALYRPARGAMVADVDLHFDGDRLLFSSLDDKGLWQVFEMKSDGSGLRQATAGPIAEVDNYDPCYLPDGRILFASTAVMQGVPCVGGKTQVANLYLMNPDGSGVRQLCFDQDHNWCPTVMNDGRVMFSRWEYGDTPHYFTRLLFRMNPDGTQQMELSGSNSYWPNSTFYARPIPGDPSKVVAVASGHHGVPRMGELILFDTARGRREADGVVQRIPGHGKQVEAVIVDGLVNGSWPKFVHPWPLSDKYFLASSMPRNGALWGIYLVDVFDNRLLLCELAGHGLFEPIPLRRTPRPPVVPDKVNPARKDAVVYLLDVYAGDGLKGVPRGTVKALRVFEWHYAYQGIGGHQCVGVESGWEPKRILGTVPVEADGSALFRVPANTPLAVQPLDGEGRALQLMRSWFVGMPGEALSCVGCHEPQSAATGNMHTAASRRPPRDIAPWHGPTRGLSFPRDVQPVLDAHCARCHDGKPRPDGKTLPNFADTGEGQGRFTKSYLALHPYVRRPGPESDYHMLPPAEYLANTSELVQMLKKGHHGVELEPEAWDRLYTWVDLNAPNHGTWTEQAGEAKVKPQHDLRAKYRKLFASIDEDPEAIYPTSYKPPAASAKPSVPDNRKPITDNPVVPGWPFDAAEAKKRQAATGPRTTRTIDLDGGGKLELVLIPAGEFVMGDPNGDADEQPLTRVRIERPFWLARTEVSNAQFRYFDPTHDSRFIDQHWKDHTTPGYPANGPELPAIRVSWQRAVAFCDWLSRKTGERFTLPTEAQWEWACRAGSATPLVYGGRDADFSKHGNLGDASLRKMAVTGINPKPIANPSPFQDFLPKEARFDDGEMIVCAVGKYQPNPWGLLDMHGNVAEWTLSAYRPYPYVDGDGRNQATPDGLRVARGGSWHDRPKRCRSAFRLAYHSWQGVYDVGFRIACPVATPVAAAK
ncbi:MAG TPA: SUMF1/EgtB/PvdO family nonheme iron enzyme [Planctomycetota bacterium]|nr:SUMF1/EgtB/PvdO family nonheme iron enzyme [Planctomycetota bacterium]